MNYKPEAYYTMIGVISGREYLGFKTKYVKVSDTEYFGYAPCGTATSTNNWTIKKIVTGTDTIDVTWANGGESDNIWDNYLTLTYS